jgi:hypothetical protein
MNWNALGKLTGWLPGATAGSLVGLVVSLFYWSSEAAPVCAPQRFGTIAIQSNCVQTIAGDFTTPLGFTVAVMAVAGILGAIVNFIQAQSGSTA